MLIILPLRILKQSHFQKKKSILIVRDTKCNCNGIYITFYCSYSHLKFVFFCHLLSFLPNRSGSHIPIYRSISTLIEVS